ncbi:MAG: alkaline phosphatase D family protein [Flavobacteriales bacterium]|nr:alkaline phosphatase D family protein [Flavobacteriales bacterium]
MTKNADSLTLGKLDVGVDCTIMPDTNMAMLFKKHKAYKLFFTHPNVSTVSFSIRLSKKKSEAYSYRIKARNNDFLFGSCAFIADGLAKGYRAWNTTKIYRSMQKEQVDKMIWMGDNIYLMPYYDLKNLKRIYNRYIGIRTNKDLSSFLSSGIKHYATWDDHDFGPNNCEGDYINAPLTTLAFKNFWVNPTGINNKDVSIVVKNKEVDFFLTDSRTNRSVLKGDYLGKQQLNDLKESLKNSSAIFKVIVSSSQVINPLIGHDSYREFPEEREDLLNFIQKEKINGVLFFSGDRHHSEIYVGKRENYRYDLYDLTCSPLSSPKHRLKFSKHLKNVGDRVENSLILKKNYGCGKIILLEGKKALEITFKNKKGCKINSFVFTQEMLGY